MNELKSLVFPQRSSKEIIEEGSELQPKFDANGLIPCVTQDADSKEVLMVAYMNDLALSRTIETGEAHYWSRSRGKLWHKGEQSGLTQKVVSLRVDCDQDCVVLMVRVQGGACCHVGYKTCFFRELSEVSPTTDFSLTQIESDKVFDPKKVYGG